MNRTILAFAAIIPLAVVAGLVANALDLSSWAGTALAVLILLLVTLIDREGFYGTSDRRHAPRS